MLSFQQTDERHIQSTEKALPSFLYSTRQPNEMQRWREQLHHKGDVLNRINVINKTWARAYEPSLSLSRVRARMCGGEGVNQTLDSFNSLQKEWWYQQHSLSTSESSAKLQYNKLLKENAFWLLRCLNSKLVVLVVDNNVMKLWSTKLGVYDLRRTS
jgi:hypothetical protein